MSPLLSRPPGRQGVAYRCERYCTVQKYKYSTVRIQNSGGAPTGAPQLLQRWLTSLQLGIRSGRQQHGLRASKQNQKCACVRVFSTVLSTVQCRIARSISDMDWTRAGRNGTERNGTRMGSSAQCSARRGVACVQSREEEHEQQDDDPRPRLSKRRRKR